MTGDRNPRLSKSKPESFCGSKTGEALKFSPQCPTARSVTCETCVIIIVAVVFVVIVADVVIVVVIVVVFSCTCTVSSTFPSFK